MRSQPAPLVVDIGPTANGRLQLTLTNHAKAPITAYVYTTTFQAAGARAVEGEFFRDSAFQAAERPIQPNQQVIRLVDAAGQTNVQCQFRAALFADGTAFGDASWAQRILLQRAYTAQALQWVRSDLTAASGLSRPASALLSALNSSRSANARGVADRDQSMAIARIYDWVAAMIKRDAQSDSEALTAEAGQGLLAAIDQMLGKFGR
jgi:hypothetical protein